jgi:hypothetical protein
MDFQSVPPVPSDVTNRPSPECRAQRDPTRQQGNRGASLADASGYEQSEFVVRGWHYSRFGPAAGSSPGRPWRRRRCP